MPGSPKGQVRSLQPYCDATSNLIRRATRNRSWGRQCKRLDLGLPLRLCKFPMHRVHRRHCGRRDLRSAASVVPSLRRPSSKNGIVVSVRSCLCGCVSIAPATPITLVCLGSIRSRRVPWHRFVHVSNASHRLSTRVVGSCVARERARPSRCGSPWCVRRTRTAAWKRTPHSATMGSRCEPAFVAWTKRWTWREACADARTTRCRWNRSALDSK